MDRRQALAGLAGVTAAGLTGVPPAVAASPTSMAHGKVETTFLDFDDPVERFEAHFRMERDLVEEQGSNLTWYFWLAYIVPEGSSPRPFVRNEGMEYSYFRKVADHTYRIHAHNVSFPRSLETNKYAETLENPITGETVTPEPVVLLNDPGTVHSPKGFRNLSGDGSYVEPYGQFRIENDLIKYDSVRTAPPNWPVKHIESSIQWCEYDLFKDTSITGLPTRSTGVYVFPYPEWLNMGDRGGHMLGYWDSVTLNDVSDFPDEFLAKMERDYPELLKPQWAMFDKPAPFEY